MDVETPQEQVTHATRLKADAEAGVRKTGTRFILSHKPSKRAFSKRLITDSANYKPEDGDRGSAKAQKPGKAQVSAKQTSKEMTSMFQKNFHYLVQSKNLKRKKREHRRNKLTEAVEFSAKYPSRILTRDRRKKNFVEDVNHSELAPARVNMSTLSSKIGSKAKKLAKKYMYSQNHSEFQKSGRNQCIR